VNATSIRCSLHDAVRLRKPRSRRVPEMTTVGRKARLRGVMGAARRAAAFRALGNAGNSQLPRTHPSLRFFKRDSCVGQANTAGSNPQVAVHVAWGAANRCRRCLKLVPGRLGNGGKHAGSSGPPCARRPSLPKSPDFRNFRRPGVRRLWPSRNPSRSPANSSADRRPVPDEVHRARLKP